MNNFISAYPGAIYLIGLGLIVFIIYQYKVGRKLEGIISSAEESAILTEIGKVVTSLDNVVTEVGRLFKRDGEKEEDIGELKERMGKQETKCLEREKICPALRVMGRHLRDGDDSLRAHKRDTNGESQPC